MPPTLEDVGRRCGVSRSTVSRVINDSPLVNDETKERVLEAIQEMGYAPNFIARSLTKNCTETIAVTLPDITGGVYPEILAGMDEVASQRGYHVLVVFLGGARPQSTAVDELIKHRRVDAIISVAGTVEDDQLSALSTFNMPIVCMARKSPVAGFPSVLFDDFGGARQAVECLLAQGCKNLVHIRGPESNYDAEERTRGFVETAKAAGLSVEGRVFEGDFLRDSGSTCMEQILDKGLKIDGLFAGNDEMAIGAMEVLNEKGVSVPEEIAVVGFDDIDLSHFVGLSTIRVPLRKLGMAATRLAFDMIDGKESKDDIVLPTEVVPRASCVGGSA